MKAPEFWKYGNGGIRAVILSPLGWVFCITTFVRQAIIKPWKSTKLILCIGNVVVGGAGKTPVSIDLGRRLVNRNVCFNYLSRGYGGFERGPHLVDISNDEAERVGDEPLLLAKVAPTWVSQDRVLGAKSVIKQGIKNVIMDDGLQNPYIEKSFSILVVDGAYGFGNGKVFPSGPLREPLDRVIKRVNVAVILGSDIVGVEKKLCSFSSDLPVLFAEVIPGPEITAFVGKSITAFAGIAHPEKFFLTLENSGCNLINKIKFPDHHVLTSRELSALKEEARASNSFLVTTEKDWVRLPKDQKREIKFLTIRLKWNDEIALNSILDLFC